MKHRLRIFGRRIGHGVRRAGVAAAGLQGLAGAALVAVGVYLEWGVSWAAIVAGAFLLLGAWAAR